MKIIKKAVARIRSGRPGKRVRAADKTGQDGRWGALLFASVIPVILALFFLMARGDGARGERVRLQIVIYHIVASDCDTKYDYQIPTSALEDDLKAYQKSDWSLVALSEVIAYAQGGSRLPERSLLLVFDDGYACLKTEVLPLLKKYDAPAVVSVIGARAEGAVYEPLGSVLYLSWDELAALGESGLIEFQYHTMSLHLYGERRGVEKLPGETDAAYGKLIKADVKRMSDLARYHGVKLLPSFAYPYGIVEPLAEKALAESGFVCTMTSDEHVNILTRGHPACLYLLGRFNRSGYLTTEAVIARLDW